MITATPLLAGVTAEAAFPQPRPFSKDQLDRLAVWATDPHRGFGLRPEQVRVRHSDVMFDYELSAVLFNGMGTLKFNALGASFTASGARTPWDLNLLQDSVGRFIREALGPEISAVAIGAHAQVQTASPTERDTYLARFRVAPEVVSAGVIGFLHPHPWLSDVRVAIEATIGSSDSLFIAWNTTLHITESWEQHVAAMPEVFVGAAAIFGLNLQSPAV